MKTNKLTAEEMVIADRLKQMKMSGMAEAYEEQLLNPNSDLVSFQDRFSAIINFEWEVQSIFEESNTPLSSCIL